MALPWLFAAAHLVALGIGLGAVWTRALALDQAAEPAALRRALAADAWWGVAAGLWLATGLVRLLVLEKGTAYYLHNGLFHAKMALFLGVLALELTPMITLSRWRAALRAGAVPDIRRAATLARISRVEAVVVLLMVIAATGMARGYGSF